MIHTVNVLIDSEFPLHFCAAIHFSAYPGRPARTCGPPEDCYEAEGPEIDIEAVDLLEVSIEIGDYFHELKRDDSRAWADLRKLFEDRMASDKSMRESIENECLEAAGEAEQGAREAAMEAAAEARAEQRADERSGFLKSLLAR
jgi:hypothetical protein